MFRYSVAEQKEIEEQVEYLRFERLDYKKLKSFRCNILICTETKWHPSDVY